jgi:anti-sigma regulatory factor (Ser/Thr protein kinase)
MPGPAPELDADLALEVWARDALAATGALPGVHRVGLALAEGGGRHLAFTASDRTHASVASWCRVDAYDDLPLNTTVRTGASVLGALEDLAADYADFVGRQDRGRTHSIAAVPIVAAGQVLGGYVLFFDSAQHFDDAQQELLEEAGRDLGSSLRQVQVRTPRPEHDVLADEAPGVLNASYVVADDVAAVGEARQFLRETFLAWGLDEDLIYTASLCLSELVTNAVIHAVGGCLVRLRLDGDVVTTSVVDDGLRLGPDVPSGVDPLQTHGRGLQIVEALAERWGSVLDESGSTVWFVLGADQQATA